MRWLAFNRFYQLCSIERSTRLPEINKTRGWPSIRHILSGRENWWVVFRRPSSIIGALLVFSKAEATHHRSQVPQNSKFGNAMAIWSHSAEKTGREWAISMSNNSCFMSSLHTSCTLDLIIIRSWVARLYRKHLEALGYVMLRCNDWPGTYDDNRTLSLEQCTSADNFLLDYLRLN